MTRVLGVIGYPIGHSVSPQMHAAAIAHLGLDYAYHAFDVTPDRVGEAIAGVRGLGFAGLSVTVPHKEAVIPLLDEITPAAGAMGAVNTIVNQDGRLTGHNTDWEGFLRALTDEGVDPQGGHCVVIGAGGAGRAVCYALLQAGAEVGVFDTDPERLGRLIADLGGEARLRPLHVEAVPASLGACDLLVNCTPVGMYPHVDDRPAVDPDAIPVSAYVCDLVYNPLETELLRRARERGCRTSNGVGLLAWQGAIAFQLWTGRPGPVAVMKEAIVSAVSRSTPT